MIRLKCSIKFHNNLRFVPYNVEITRNVEWKQQHHRRYWMNDTMYKKINKKRRTWFGTNIYYFVAVIYKWNLNSFEWSEYISEIYCRTGYPLNVKNFQCIGIQFRKIIWWNLLCRLMSVWNIKYWFERKKKLPLIKAQLCAWTQPEKKSM